MLRLAALVLLAAAAAACTTERRLECAATLAALKTQPGPHEPERRLALASPTSDPFFAGLPRLALVAARMRAAPPDPPERVRIGRFEDAEADIRAGLRDRGRRDVAVLYVRGTSVAVASPPDRAAAVLVDLAAERDALSADEAEDLGPLGDGGRRMRFALLGMGPSLFKIDLRWTVSATRRARPDGTVLVRYDLDPEPAPENVSLFAGVSILEPWQGGTRWTEVVVVGSPLTPPPLTGGSARAEATRILTRRIERLAARMHGTAK